MLDFKDFLYYFTNFESEDIINESAQRFKQKLIDDSEKRGKPYNLNNAEDVQVVFREFFLASMSANLQILELYNHFLSTRIVLHNEQSLED